MVRVFRYRLYPTRQQELALVEMLRLLRGLYNGALQELEQHDAIAVEDLNIKGLAAGMLARQVHDAGWAQFVTILSNKAERAGREIHRVDAHGTSQLCSECGCEVRKGLHVREHRCPHCGYTEDRDINAARNIHQRLGHSRRGGVSRGHPDEPRSPHLAR